MRGKSLRRADIEEAFEDVLRGLKPREALLDVAAEMFRDAWEMRRDSVKAASESVRANVDAINARIDKLVDRLVDADGEDVVAAYERKLKELQHEKRLGEERLANVARPRHTFEESFEHAMNFLLNPWKIWNSGRFDLRQVVLRLAFSEPLTYDRKSGLRTAKKLLYLSRT